MLIVFIVVCAYGMTFFSLVLRETYKTFRYRRSHRLAAKQAFK